MRLLNHCDKALPVTQHLPGCLSTAGMGSVSVMPPTHVVTSIMEERVLAPVGWDTWFSSKTNNDTGSPQSGLKSELHTVFESLLHETLFTEGLSLTQSFTSEANRSQCRRQNRGPEDAHTLTC